MKELSREMAAETSLAKDAYAYSHLIFTHEKGKYSKIPEFPGIYFLTAPGTLYIGCGMNLRTRIPKSISERRELKQDYNKYHFIVIPISERPDLLLVETQFIAAANSIIYKNGLEFRYGLRLMNASQVYLMPRSAWCMPFTIDYFYPVGAVQTVLKGMGIPVNDLPMGDPI